MAKQIIDIGSAPNDGTGDTGRDGGAKINENFTELYDFAEGSEAFPGDIEVTDVLTAGGFRLSNSSWDDLRFPLTGRNIDTTSGRLDYDFHNGTVTFATNARFNIAETVSFIVQMPHAWKEGTDIYPHIHWLQQAAAIPNWLLGVRIYKKDTTRAALESDFSNMSFSQLSSHAFAYTADNLEQISSFPVIDMSGVTISDIVHICLWRDTANVSTIFSGSENTNVQHVREFDVHNEIDSFGSDTEFIKDDPPA